MQGGGKVLKPALKKWGIKLEAASLNTRVFISSEGAEEKNSCISMLLKIDAEEMGQSLKMRVKFIK